MVKPNSPQLRMSEEFVRPLSVIARYIGCTLSRDDHARPAKMISEINCST